MMNNTDPNSVKLTALRGLAFRLFHTGKLTAADLQMRLIQLKAMES